MGNEDDERVATCPYCGSDKLTSLDWGFADWECETCRNNFRSPRYRSNSPPFSNYNRGNADPPKNSIFYKIGNFLEEYCCLAFYVLCIIFIIIFFIFRFYEIVIMPLL